MSLDFARLAQQGRAYSGQRAWTPEELDALLTLEKERGLSRTVAADFIRNGITTLEAYDKAKKKKFEPMTQVEAAAQAESALKDNAFAVEPAPKAEEKPEPKEEEETEPEVEPEVTPETPVVEDESEGKEEEGKE